MTARSVWSKDRGSPLGKGVERERVEVANNSRETRILKKEPAHWTTRSEQRNASNEDIENRNGDSRLTAEYGSGGNGKSEKKDIIPHQTEEDKENGFLIKKKTEQSRKKPGSVLVLDGARGSGGTVCDLLQKRRGITSASTQRQSGDGVRTGGKKSQKKQGIKKT